MNDFANGRACLMFQLYQRNCENPPIQRDIPPISGRIIWARQLMRRIRSPMDSFELHPTCLKTSDASKIIRNFNQLATVLVEFEVLYHHGWLKQVEVARSGIELIDWCCTKVLIWFWCASTTRELREGLTFSPRV